MKFFWNVNRFTHLQNFEMLLAICEKKLAIFASTGNYFRPWVNDCHPVPPAIPITKIYFLIVIILTVRFYTSMNMFRCSTSG